MVVVMGAAAVTLVVVAEAVALVGLILD